MLKHRVLLISAVLGLLVAACADNGGSNGADPAGSGGEEPGASTTDDPDGSTEAVDYPTRSIRWIIGQSAGGGSDLEFRRMQPHLEELLGVPLEVEFITGAGGAIAWSQVQDAEPDGYTVTSALLPHVVLQPLSRDDAGFDIDGFDFVSFNVESPQALAVLADGSPYADFDEWRAAVEQNPGGTNVGGFALFTGAHGMATQLRQQGLDVNYVTTGGGATEIIAALRGGHFDSGFIAASNLSRQPELRAIAVGGEERHHAMPDVPTFAELGFEVTGQTVWGVAAPSGTPQEIIDILSDAIETVLHDEEVAQGVEEDGLILNFRGPSEAEQMAREWHADYEALIDDMKLDDE